MNKYFEKGKKLLIKKGYYFVERYPVELSVFKKYSAYWSIEIWLDTENNKLVFKGCVEDLFHGITTQAQIDELQLAFNNLKADLQELEEIKYETKNNWYGIRKRHLL